MTERCCPFCAIVSRGAEAAIILQDDRVTAFMDQNPINPGHVLVIPNHHEPDFEELSVAAITHLMRNVKRIAIVIKRIYSPKKVGLAVGGFDVPHAHMHIIPMHEYHDLTSKRLLDGALKRAGVGELREEAARIRLGLSGGEAGAV